MTYTVSSGTLNSTIPYRTVPFHVPTVCRRRTLIQSALTRIVRHLELPSTAHANIQIQSINTFITRHSKEAAHCIRVVRSVTVTDAFLVRLPQQGAPSFSTLNFHDFSMTQKWKSMTHRHNIYFQINDIRLMNAWHTRISSNSSICS